MIAPAPGQSHSDLSLADLSDEMQESRFDHLVVLPRVGSTIDECRRRADEGVAEGLVVLAEEQESGRGQRGHSWHSPRGVALYLSALLRPPLHPAESAVLMSVAGVAAAEAALELGVTVCLKKPNDVMVPTDTGRRKLAGLLVDTTVQGESLKAVIISIGMNVHQEEEDFPLELRGQATSLALAGASAPSRERAAGAFLRRLEFWRAEMGRTGDWMARVRRRHEDLT